VSPILRQLGVHFGTLENPLHNENIEMRSDSKASFRMRFDMQKKFVILPILGVAFSLFGTPREHGYGTNIDWFLLFCWFVFGLIIASFWWLLSKW